MDQILDKLKESALKAKEGAGKLAKVFAKRTSDAVAGTKLSFSINEANNKIRDIYAKIGKDIYNMYLEGEIDNSSFESEFEQIEKLMASNGIWNCLSCFACLERCPRQAEPAKLIEAVRLTVIRQQGMNHLKPEQIPELLDENLPQQAITSAFRKFAK